MYDIYDKLNLPRSSTPEEVERAYQSLHATLSERRFLPGMEGNDAARRLTELQSAYSQYKDNFKRTSQGGASGFDEIDRLVKLGDVDKAQAILDSMMDRNGEWHYMQSIVFYRRDWLTESRRHLVMAINLEPTNTKYRSALEKLDIVMGNGTINPNNLGDQQAFMMQQQRQRGQQDMLCNCLSAYCIGQLCCNATRGC